MLRQRNYPLNRMDTSAVCDPCVLRTPDGSPLACISVDSWAFPWDHRPANTTVRSLILLTAPRKLQEHSAPGAPPRKRGRT
jgi:hypothetical protein